MCEIAKYEVQLNNCFDRWEKHKVPKWGEINNCVSEGLDRYRYKCNSNNIIFVVRKNVEKVY